MKRVYECYEDWEDYKNGMWRKLEKQDESEWLLKAIQFTGDHIRYGKAMLRVIAEWPVTCRHNLTDTSTNQRAFIGHAACSLEFNCPEYITRMAWGKLTERQRIDANKEADKAIKEWRRLYNISFRKEKNLSIQLCLYEKQD